ncbi:hypothetical protein COO60DRAFT_1557589 [Scenedesmus sp. NREL 46B-D3]|nr:hypothetical protein COO60DRAFT_1557589 [Scenedesmus sp. NREL 46B-D3]
MLCFTSRCYCFSQVDKHGLPRKFWKTPNISGRCVGDRDPAGSIASTIQGQHRLQFFSAGPLACSMDHQQRNAWHEGQYVPLAADPPPAADRPNRSSRRDVAPERAERRSRSATQQRPGGNLQPRSLPGLNAAPGQKKENPARNVNIKLPAMIPSQKPVQLRQKDKLVLLPRSASNSDAGEAAASNQEAATAARVALAQAAAAVAEGDAVLDMSSMGQPAHLFEDLAQQAPDMRGRITIYCIAESLSRDALEGLVGQCYPQASTTKYSEVLHVALPAPVGEPCDAFFFEYGVVCCWGFPTAKLEQELLQSVAKKAQQRPLPPREVEVDRFEYNYSSAAPPSMQNDTITISRHHSHDHQTKLAICHALAQSTKLCVYEERVVELVLDTKHLPQALALHGEVSVSSQEVAQRIGQVFLQRSAVNLLSSVLDTPEFFWSAPDHLQVLYERACDYLELDTRVEVLNARFQVLQEMLDMLRDHQQNHHSARLEWIIIWLIAVELVVGVFELMGLFGLVGREH